jgi:hypothetical protein
MVHTNPEFETSNLILDFEFDQHLESHKHVINIIMWFRDMGCYSRGQQCLSIVESSGACLTRGPGLALARGGKWDGQTGSEILTARAYHRVEK